MKYSISLILLSVIQLVIQTQAAGCGNIPNCKSYKPDPCNTCSCTDPINNPTLAMCTRAYCPDPTFIPECTRCIDGYTLLNKRCTSLSISPVEPIQMPLPIQIEPVPVIEPVICQTDVNCRSWEGYYCIPDIKCRMSTNIDPTAKCDKVCLAMDSSGVCNVNNDCNSGYECIERFCVKYQQYIAPIRVIGRPYNINKNVFDLKADIKEINCNEYEFYFNDIEYSNGRNISVNNGIISDWIDRGLSEHAAVGTFAKFNLDLMSIGAPLWFLEMANNASFDEIRHTKITFDIVNMYIKHGNNNNNNGNCIFYNDFPMHNIEIDGNYNRISLDAANGGCFGETLSVFVTYLNGYNSNNNKIQNYLYVVSIDEIRHASLSWVTVKWIMDKKGKNVQVYDINWWKTQLEYLLKHSSDNNNKNIEQYVYKYVIPSVFEVLWLDSGDLIQIKDYNKLYHSINSLLKDHFDVVIEKIIQ